MTTIVFRVAMYMLAEWSALCYIGYPLTAVLACRCSIVWWEPQVCWYHFTRHSMSLNLVLSST